MLKRASSSSDTSLLRYAKSPRISEGGSCFDSLTIQIIPTKLSAEYIDRIGSLVEDNGGRLTDNPSEANIIITAIGMRKRLERHIKWEFALSKPIVTPDWVEKSLQKGICQPFSDYASIPELKAQMSPPSIPSASSTSSRHESKKPSLISPTKFAPRYTSSFACERHSPLICPNQDLLTELAVIMKGREIDGNIRSMSSYARSISALKAVPFVIKSFEDVDGISHIGPKTCGMITEFLRNGVIQHAREISASPKYQCLILFNTIFGIGPTTALKLYNLGLRTLEDLNKYANVDNEEELQIRSNLPESESHGAKRLNWVEGLRLRDDLQAKIPRSEVEEMGAIIQTILDDLLPGSESTICGGYRRGKPESNDVDIVFTHPAGPEEEEKAADLCTRLVFRLRTAELVTHLAHFPSFRNRQGLHPRPRNRSGWDTLEKAMTIMKLPPSSNQDAARRHRRVDLIYAPRSVYWCAIVGWTGSITFERDIRLWAKRKKSYKFDSSGITRLRDTKSILARSEKDVFDILGLDWVEPVLRNADL